eukprot:CAMPEP_0113710734 /NCGR_PEP_ID=MMETSP0038_2-20120614/30334_1 /TAXON_ID=2898 /ORGANISM="Cryptomonas paramecium" /LENGTH=60 /DNA_ID=CAMNT_0000636849 /DNA_START=66 /DNA_END=248 /DNA_ORIENTATION=+ /assembly_acc=CAM_ASM_000170
MAYTINDDACYQLGAMGKLEDMEKQENQFVGRDLKWEPGMCPAQYRYLNYGLQVLGKSSA